MKKEGEKIKKIVSGVHPVIGHKRSFGQKAADMLAEWAGSWTFIIILFLFLGVWVITNGYFILKYAKGDISDPFPFILLNLILATLSTIQAPIILMSQNREIQRDRLRAEYDYEINKKAEKEIREIKGILLRRKG